MTESERERITLRAGFRADFIKRLFAVAISVGFATTLSKMPWVTTPSFPNPGEWQQLAVLFVGMYLTVLSWDGYMLSIDKKPLFSNVRFTIDVTLVFIYMFFLISSKKGAFWLPLTVAIFWLYVLWDGFTVREHYSEYDRKAPKPAEGEIVLVDLNKVFGVYIQGALNRPQIGRGPISTLVWAIVFTTLALLNAFNPEAHPTQQYFFIVMVCIGLFQYRQDKSRAFDALGRPAYTMGERCVGGMLIILTAILFFYFASWSS